MNKSHDSTQIRQYADVEITGKNPEDWQRVGVKLIVLIEKLSDQITNVSGFDAREGEALAKDITSIATRWAEAKIERPSLENDSIKADILKKLADAQKTRSEAHQIASDTRNKEVLVTLEAMERLISLQVKMEQLGITITLEDRPSHTLDRFATEPNKKIQPAAESGG